MYGLMKPAAFAAAARKFCRSLPMGYALMLLGTGWFLWYLDKEAASDFLAYKQYLFIGFAAIGVGACIFVKDYLAVRGLAVVFMLLAKLMVDTARWVDSEWRLVIVVWAYVLIVAGIWLTVSPWRLRDLLNWATATEQRVRVGCAVRLAFAVLVVILGATAFRGT